MKSDNQLDFEKTYSNALRSVTLPENLREDYKIINCLKESDVSVLQYALELCRIITLLHQEVPPIIHRDIKPENFVISAGDGKLYLIDCDSARVYKNGQEHDTLFVGTPSHVAPETYGYAQSSIQSDVYGLGKTLLYMCCGRSDDAAVQDCCLSADFKRIIQKCIAFSPKDRYKSVEAVERELRKVYRPYIRHLCDSLACYDRLLYTKIGHFSDYSGMLYNYLDFWLNPNTASPDMPLYQYCNQPENITNTNYTEALIEVLKTALRAAIDQDCLEMPDNI